MAGIKKKGLGKGLSALIGDAAPVVQTASDAVPATELAAGEKAEGRRRLPIEYLVRNQKQPRLMFDEAAIEELSASIKTKGLLQPILVRELAKDKFEIVAGERRWRAAQKAGVYEVPVVIRDLDDGEVLEIGLIENIQRRDLTPVEEAIGYRRLMNEFGHTQEVVSKLVSKSRSHVANLLRLLTLPDSVQEMVNEGQLSMGHARALIGAADPAVLARRVLAEGLSVRQTEELAKEVKGKGKREPRPGGTSGKSKDADTLALEKDLSETVGMKVTIDHKGEAGKLSIDYLTLEQLDDICARLGVSLM
ncbi:ParB/RepB/Spo0J family partition protein [Temperatibacter marinus]|uniref:ParB/RepB/Spo0J family partition protein n=1 Tax=Temperatibacter marinus TaxID=1456591 RepID=A0AA52EDX0_9PROT|nr:ParB/RepB/Spo0J family partition protein [Temperatibacter marinus]WND03677.1 ParB/RepB/Spo0J family partition protein [Temperatibacter marinus]